MFFNCVLQSVEPEGEHTLESVAEEPEGATPTSTANVLEQVSIGY